MRTDGFELLVLPDRVQIQFPPAADDADAYLARVLGGIAKTLPHTPYSAIGLNNKYEVRPADSAGFAAWNRKTFASPWALAQTQSKAQERFGCSFAYDAFDGARMRIRAEVSAKTPAGAGEPGGEATLASYVVTLNCNLHRDLKDLDVEPTRELTRMLSRWKRVREQTRSLARSLMR
ncbi:MAG: hypothetical protein C4547_11525 [Phycisphaerales bacterium]|nr:MAG: hypothetical protein C4547_11525 [Phycisphaerales bacterium]